MGISKKMTSLLDLEIKDENQKNNKGVQRCSARCCFVSFHDVNINWIQCDKCDQEFHLMCEVLTSVE